MNKNWSMLLFFSICIGISASAQTVKDHIEKRAKDPATSQNAAKADAYLLRNKIRDDSLSASNTIKPVPNQEKKKKDCGKKRNPSTKNPVH